MKKENITVKINKGQVSGSTLNIFFARWQLSPTDGSGVSGEVLIEGVGSTPKQAAKHCLKNVWALHNAMNPNLPTMMDFQGELDKLKPQKEEEG